MTIREVLVKFLDKHPIFKESHTANKALQDFMKELETVAKSGKNEVSEKEPVEPPTSTPEAPQKPVEPLKTASEESIPDEIDEQMEIRDITE